jgi:cytochrome c peroxidase
MRALVVTLIACHAALVAAQTPWRETPRGLDPYLPVPKDNPPTAAKIALGRRLFFDRQLSADGSISCATCHDPARAFADDRPIAIGVRQRRGTRNAPSLVNRGYGTAFFWDGRADSLEAQVVQPIENPDELGSSVAEVVTRLRRDRTYVDQFRQAFGRPMAGPDVARALASYVRSIQSGDAPFDQFSDGVPGALSETERLGLRVFRGRGLCTTCHLGPTFSDERFHNTGVAWKGSVYTDAGRATVTKLARDRGAFKTPSLRDVARTAPYMHDGSLATLEDVVAFYNDGGRANPELDPDLFPLKLTPAQQAALVAFLRTLNGIITEGSATSPKSHAPSLTPQAPRPASAARRAAPAGR